MLSSGQNPIQHRVERGGESVRQKENAIYDIFQTDNKVLYNILDFFFG